MKRIILSALGWLFLSLAMLGAVLPLLPTTPFALLSLFFFNKSSPRMARWLLVHPWFGPTIHRWQESRTLSLKVKIWALTLLSLSMMMSLWLAKENFWLSAFLWTTWISLLFFLGRIRTEPKDSDQAVKACAPEEVKIRETN
jgi:uncharacterized membrane protein YbaN (DUF454 family)